MLSDSLLLIEQIAAFCRLRGAESVECKEELECVFSDSISS